MRDPRIPQSLGAVMKFSFTVTGFMPITSMSERDVKLVLWTARSMALAQISAAVQVVPTEAMLDEIELTPHLGGVS